MISGGGMNMPGRAGRLRLTRLMVPGRDGSRRHIGAIWLEADDSCKRIDLGELGVFQLAKPRKLSIYRDAVRIDENAGSVHSPLDHREIAVLNGRFFYRGELVGTVRNVLIHYDAVPTAPMIFQPEAVQGAIVEAYRNADAFVTRDGVLEYRPRQE